MRFRNTDEPALLPWLNGSSRPKSKLAISCGSGTIASRGGVLVRSESAFARLAASLALAICARNALDEASAFGVCSVLSSAASDLRAAFALAICSRRAMEELDTFRAVSGVFPGESAILFRIDVLGEVAVPGGEIAVSNMPLRDGRDLGVRATMLLLVDSGRSFGAFCRFEVCDSGTFFTVETGRDIEDSLLGVLAAGVTFALKLLLPGAVMDSLPGGLASLFGVAGAAPKVPSLVVGLLPLLLDIAEAGRSGGGMLLSALKKLDLRLPLPPAGEEGNCDRLSIVRSERDGRDAFLATCKGSGRSSCTA